MKKRRLIVAMSEKGRFIDLTNWNLKDDRISFKNLGIGQANIAGRTTYELFPDGNRPLPERTNIVMTTDPIWTSEDSENDGVIVVHTLWEALEEAEKAPGEYINIIGGANIYTQALNSIVFDEIYITIVSGNFEGTVRFPHLPFSLENDYEIIKQEHFTAGERNSHDFVIMGYKRTAIAA